MCSYTGCALHISRGSIHTDLYVISVLAHCVPPLGCFPDPLSPQVSLPSMYSKNILLQWENALALIS